MRLLIIGLSLALFGCGGGSSDENSDGDTVGAEIAEDFNQAMEDAAAVADELEAAAEEVEAAIEEAEGAIDEAVEEVEDAVNQ